MSNSNFSQNPGQPQVDITRQQMRPSGLPCPVCQGFIPTSMQQIITDSAIICPHCGLRLTINRQLSRPAIEALKKVQQAQADFDRKTKSM